MIKDFFLGIGTFFKSISFINKNGLAHFYLYPILFSGVLFWGSTKFVDILSDPISSWGLEKNIGEFWLSLTEWLMTIVIWILVLIINRYIVLIFLSPVFAFLSEKAEGIITNNDYPFSWKQTLKDALRGALIAIKNLAIEIFIVALCVVLKWIFPPIAILTIPVIWVTAWYFMGFSFIDYNHERQRLSSRQSSKRIWQRKGLAIGNGMLFTILAYIPIVGVTFGAVWATVGATLAIHKNTASYEKLETPKGIRPPKN